MADIKVATTSFALPAATGTFDVTIASLGWTPKAVLMLATVAGSTASNGTILNTDIYQSIGASDNVAEWSCGTNADHGVTTMSTESEMRSDAVLFFDIVGSDTIFFHVSALSGTAGPIADGWRFDMVAENTGDATRIAHVVFFGGSDLQVDASRVALGTQDTEVDVTAPGFEPDLVVFGLCGTTAAAGPLADATLTFGAAHNGTGGITQKAAAVTSQDGRTSDDAASDLLSNRVGSQMSVGVHDYKVEVANFDASGFSLFARDGASGGDEIGYLALRDNSAARDAQWWVGSVDSPTSAASDWDVTDPGFEPELVILSGGYGTAEDTLQTAGNAAIMFNALSDGTREFCGAIAYDAGAAVSNLHIVEDTHILDIMDPAGTRVFDATNLQFTANGWKIAVADITTANGTARKWFGVAIASGGAAGAGLFNLALMGAGR